MAQPFITPEAYAELLREVEAEIARDMASVLPKLTEHQGLDADFLHRAFLKGRGTFSFPAFAPDTPDNRRALAQRCSFGYDVVGGLSVTLLAFQDSPWITPADLHLLAEGHTVDQHPRVPCNQLTHCPCLAPTSP
ncbi:hypothetical protein [Streptomyces sp. NPDC051546]|uniref:hypothetical protein n=1 Tax=Streptomyces sp. NPDC051546 TaxID=3365655 RepID=UPI0037A7A9B4